MTNFEYFLIISTSQKRQRSSEIISNVILPTFQPECDMYTSPEINFSEISKLFCILFINKVVYPHWKTFHKRLHRFFNRNIVHSHHNKEIMIPNIVRI